MLSEKASNSLNLPKDIFLGASIMHITGKYELYIENYKKIIEFNDEMIKIQAVTCKICVYGKRLQIEYFNNADMKIVGRIANIEFI